MTSLAAPVNVYLLGNNYALYMVTADGVDTVGFRRLVQDISVLANAIKEIFGVCLVSINGRAPLRGEGISETKEKSSKCIVDNHLLQALC